MPRLWTDTTISLGISTGSLSFVDLTSTFLQNETRLAQLTLVRTIIGIDVAYSVHDAGEGSQQATMGICAVSRPSEAVSGAIPNPQTDAEYPIMPWVWRVRYRVYGFAADQPAVFNRRIDLDIWAKRIVKNSEIIFIAHNAPEEGVVTAVLVSGLVRCLYLVG